MRAKQTYTCRQGEKNTQARLTEAAVREIRKVRRGLNRQRLGKGDKRSVYALARKYGVSACMISKISHGKAWRHVE